MIKKIYSSKGEWVGNIDIEKSIYHTQRDNNQNQVFKYISGNPLAIDRFVLSQLAKNNIKFILILVTNFKNELSFYCVSSMENFLLNSEIFNYGTHGIQRRMTMNKWEKAKTLEEVKKIISKMNLKLETFINTTSQK